MSLVFIRFLACFKCGLEFTEEKLFWTSNGKGRICRSCKELDRPRFERSDAAGPKSIAGSVVSADSGEPS